jgi:MFS family permease
LNVPDPPTIGGRGRDRPGARAGEAWRLALLFGALAFLQGIGEPTEGLMAQPVRSLLRASGQTAGAIAAFSALLGIPWILKPLYGLLCDFVPLFGTRRKGYLAVAGGATALTLLGLFALPIGAEQSASLLGWLLVPSIAVALGDVASDALMIERGRPRGLTGLLQAVQWSCLYAAGIVNGLLGGLLCELRLESWAFLVCGVGGLATMTLVLFAVREPARNRPRPGSGRSLAILAGALRPGAGSVLAVGGFLLLWNFNPFSNVVLHLHMTRALGFSERFYGVTEALTAVASIAASVGYGFYCRRVPMRVLVHASIVLGVLSTLAYATVTDERSAVVVTLVAGATYMTATLIQLDLAARSCPPRVAGTLFALLMALENLGASASTGLGGFLYDHGVERWGSRRAFEVLVLVGSAFTACCWLLVPLLPEADTTSRQE